MKICTICIALCGLSALPAFAQSCEPCSQDYTIACPLSVDEEVGLRNRFNEYIKICIPGTSFQVPTIAELAAESDRKSIVQAKYVAEQRCGLRNSVELLEKVNYIKDACASEHVCVKDMVTRGNSEGRATINPTSLACESVHRFLKVKRDKVAFFSQAKRHLFAAVAQAGNKCESDHRKNKIESGHGPTIKRLNEH